jgi:hypothetical protein
MINRRTRHLHNYHCPNEATRQNIKTVNEATKQSTFSVSTKTEHLSEKKKNKNRASFCYSSSALFFPTNLPPARHHYKNWRASNRLNTSKRHV